VKSAYRPWQPLLGTQASVKERAPQSTMLAGRSRERALEATEGTNPETRPPLARAACRQNGGRSGSDRRASERRAGAQSRRCR
jgi:hypothetical protein